MDTKRWYLAGAVLCAGLAAAAFTLPGRAQPVAAPLTPVEQLGKALFFDESLSANGNQSCATCHDPAAGYTGSDSDTNAHGAVYEGSVPGLYGNRKPPSAAYAGESPALSHTGSNWLGGMFWDGRADGSVLGDPLAEQAMGPFLNPLEQAVSSSDELCQKVQAGSYASLFEQAWGAGSLDCAQAGLVYERIGRAIAAYERSAEVNPFTSRFDLFWDKAKAKRLDVTKITTSNYTRYRKLGLSDGELYGLAVFADPQAANCASCHSLAPGSKGYPLFTDFSYDNLGVPRNEENPFYANLAYNPAGSAWVDNGLGGFLGANTENGKMKVPTLRNVDKRPNSTFVKAYGHNGVFKSLDEIVAFYIRRGHSGMGGMGGGMGGGGMGGGGMGGMCGGLSFGAPEVSENLAPINMIPCMNRGYLVAFLKTLSDGYFTR